MSLRENQDFFSKLPSKIILDILSRLPTSTILSCKYVRKSWLTLIRTAEFVESQFLKKAVGLTLYDSTTKLYTAFEFEEGQDPAHYELRCNPLIKFNLPPQNGWVIGSLNGIILQCHHLTFYVSNPITRDYIEIHHPQELLSSCTRLVALGFGDTKITRQHKVVALFEVEGEEYKYYCCYVYTIETRVWKEIEPPACDLDGCRVAGVFLNGNLYWLVSDFTASQPWICCFDLEDESFTSFSSPVMVGSNTLAVVLCALGDDLCLCDNRFNGIDIWLQNNDTFWTKPFVIHNTSGFFQLSYDVIYPFNVFKDGDVLMAWKHTNLLFYYFKKKKIVLKIDMMELKADTIQFLHAPSFRSLQSLGRDDVRFF